MPRDADVCKCACHQHERATFNAARQMENYPKAFVHAGKYRDQLPPLVTDPVDAVTACDRCINRHAAAITYRPPIDKPATEWVDPPRKVDPGEGSE